MDREEKGKIQAAPQGQTVTCGGMESDIFFVDDRKVIEDAIIDITAFTCHYLY